MGRPRLRGRKLCWASVPSSEQCPPRRTTRLTTLKLVPFLCPLHSTLPRFILCDTICSRLVLACLLKTFLLSTTSKFIDVPTQCSQSAILVLTQKFQLKSSDFMNLMIVNNKINPLTTSHDYIRFFSIFFITLITLLEVVNRVSETQLHVGENSNQLIWRLRALHSNSKFHKWRLKFVINVTCLAEKKRKEKKYVTCLVNYLRLIQNTCNDNSWD